MPPVPDTTPPPEPTPIPDGVPPPEPAPFPDSVPPPQPAPFPDGVPPPVVAAVLPHPPLLVPELAGAAAAELDPLRAACHQALSVVLAAADSIVVVGPGPVWGMAAPGAVGSFHPYGADVRVTLPALAGLDLPDQPQPDRFDDLPLSLAVAAFLLAGLDPPPTRIHAATVPASLTPEAAAAVGRALIAAAHGNAVGPGPDATQGRAGPIAVGAETSVGLEVAAGAATRSGPDAAAGGSGAGGSAASGSGAGGSGTRGSRVGGAAAGGSGARGSGARGSALPGPGSTGEAGGDGRVGLVVMADLSACRTEGAPGAFLPEAAGFDATVAEALRSGRPERLLALEPAEAARLLVAGLAPLQVLAGAYGARPAPPGQPGEDGGSASRVRRVAEGGSRAADQSRDDGGSGVSGRVLHEGAPYGVGYLVALLGGP